MHTAAESNPAQRPFLSPARRSLWALAALICGYLLARELGGHTGDASRAPPVWLSWLWPTVATAAVIGAILAAVWSRPRAGTAGAACRVLLFVCVLALAAGWYHHRLIVPPNADALTRAVAIAARADEPPAICVEGVALGPPRLVGSHPAGSLGRFAYAHPTWALDVACRTMECAPLDAPEQVRSTPVGGVLRVRIDADGGRDVLRDQASAPVRAGDRLVIRGVLRALDAPTNPGEPDPRPRARQQSVVGVLAVPSEALLLRVEHQGTPDRMRGIARRALASMRSFASSVLASVWHDAEAETPPLDTPPVADRVELPPLSLTAAQRASSAPTASASDRSLQARALIASMLLGVDDADPNLRPVQLAFTRLGLLHLIAISGVNMVLLAGLGVLALRLTGDRGALEPLTIAALVVLYLLILPAQAPIIRGGVMVLALLLANALGRRYDRLTVLGWVGVALAIIWPLDVFNAGYQLSFGVVAALLWVQPAFHARLFPARVRGVRVTPLPVGRAARFERLGMQTRALVRAVFDRTGHALSAAIVAWCVTTPVIAYHAGLFTPLGVLFTLLAAPLCALLLWGGYIVLLVGALCRALTSAFTDEFPSGIDTVLGGALDALGRVCVGLVDVLDALPGSSLRVPTLSPWLCGGLVAWTVVMLRWSATRRHASSHGAGPGERAPRMHAARLLSSGRGWRFTRSRAARLGAGAALLTWLAVDVLDTGLAPATLRLDALGGRLIGRSGSCLLLRATGPRGSSTDSLADALSIGALTGQNALLIDPGSSSPGAGLDRLPAALRALGVVRVRSAVLLSPNIERFNALPDLAPVVGLREVYLSPQLDAMARHGRTGAAARVERALAEAIDHLLAAGVRVHVLAPRTPVQIDDALWIEMLWPSSGDSASGKATFVDRSAIVRVSNGSEPDARAIVFAPSLTGAGWEPLVAPSSDEPQTDRPSALAPLLAGADALVVSAGAWDMVRSASWAANARWTTGTPPPAVLAGEAKRDVLKLLARPPVPASDGHVALAVHADGSTTVRPSHEVTR